MSRGDELGLNKLRIVSHLQRSLSKVETRVMTACLTLTRQTQCSKSSLYFFSPFQKENDHLKATELLFRHFWLHFNDHLIIQKLPISGMIRIVVKTPKL